MSKRFASCLVSSVIGGAAFGVSIYNILWVRLYPATSARTLALMAAAGLIGAVGYFFLLDRWIVPMLARMQARERMAVAGASTLLGLLFMFAGTGILKASPENIVFLLPSRTVEITVPSPQQVPDPQIAIAYFTTSAGDVSYGSIEYQGWERSGDKLVLTDLSSNHFRWTGKPGQEATLIFLRSPQGGLVDVRWDGASERVNLYSDKPGKYNHTHSTSIPFYASRGMALFLAALNFILVTCAGILAAWKERGILLPTLLDMIPPSGSDLTHGPEGHPIPGANRISWQTWCILAGILLLALALRLFDLGRAYLYVDELNHLLAAKELLGGVSLDSVYQRGLYMVTLPVTLFIQLFGANLWAARLPGVLLNVLAIIPLYLLVARVNPNAALLTGILYATNPWITAVARNVREYASYPFFFYLIAYGMVLFVEHFPAGFVISRDWRMITGRRSIVLAASLILPLLYGLLVDPFSSFKIVLVLYMAFFLFLLARLDLKQRSNLMVLGAIGILMGTAAVVYLFRQSFISFLPNPNPYPLRYFFPNPPQQWYFDRLALPFILAIVVSICLGIAAWRRNFVLSFLSVLFILSVIVFTLFFTRYIRPRYIFNVQFWYLPLVGIGLYGLWVLAGALLRSRAAARLALVLIFLGSSINAAQVILPAIYEKPGFMPVTEEYEYSFEPVQALVETEANKEDVIISTLYGDYASWRGTSPLRIFSIVELEADEAQARIDSLVQANESGWIILDDRGSAKTLPLRDFRIEEKHIEYIGAVGGQNVWRWSMTPNGFDPGLMRPDGG